MQKGAKFSHYTIEKKLGEGGMGEVYLAFDNSLERPVALKILSDEFSQDTNRVLRLKQEAKAASSLNHPNIITVYEIGKNADIEFIAMEFVDGKTLREAIENNELSLADAVKVAQQIAEGLSVAHTARIIHRDIKPENVMIRPDGYVRILDFGLAKPTAFLTAQNEAETIELVKTAPGVLMGSVRYMSPEQARGKSLDERSDLWSVGVVLYEMVTGKTPFEGETVSDTLANLIHLKPTSLAEILPDIPNELNRIGLKSLQKNRDERYQTAKDFALDLKNLHREIESNQPTAQLIRHASAESAARIFSEETKTRIYQTDNSVVKISNDNLAVNQSNTGSNRSLRYALFGLLGIILLGMVGFILTKLFGANKSISATFQNPQISQMSDDGKSRLPTISPDGNYIAFQSGDVGARNLMVRQLLTGSAIEAVPKSGLRMLFISFSPDGNYVYYVQANAGKNSNSLYQVPTLGGVSKKIVDDIDSNITFANDGKRIAFMRHSDSEGKDTLIVANVDGTQEKAIISSNQTEYGFLTYPTWSPKTEKIMVVVGTNIGGETENHSVAEISLDGKLQNLPNSNWKDISDIYWKKDGDGYFALASEKKGDPQQVWSISYPNGERKRITNDTNSYNWLGVSGNNNTLITVKSDASSSVWSFAPNSKELKQLTLESKDLSGDSGIIQTPNGNLIISRYRDSELNLWEITSDGKDVRQITSKANYNADPKISLDGTKICFMSNRSNLWRAWTMDIDGQNAKQLTIVGDEVNQFYPNFVNDGKTIFYAQQEKNSGLTKLMKVQIEGGTAERVLPNSTENETGVSVSPDGKKLSLILADQNYKKYLGVFPLDGDKLGKVENKFDLGQMESIKWSPDAKSLIYLSSEGISNLWQISLDGKEKKQLTNFTAGRIFNFTWARDGKQLFVSRGTVNNELILIKDETR